ncbi:MAG: nuclear transport factor 2 family protein [Acidobacteriaceae bacterium]
MDNVNGLEFAREWEAAWNRRDVEAVLQHFHEHAIFTSPIAKDIGFAADGIVRGKDAIRRYWTAGLAQNPEIHFQVRKVYQGINTLVIVFSNRQGIDRAEVLTFKNGLVIEGHGTLVAE